MRNCASGRDDSWKYLIHSPDQVLDLLGMRPKVLGELVEIGIGYRRKALLVDIGDDLDADRFQLGRRGPFQVESLPRLLLADFIARRQHPFLLFGGKALPQL